MFLFFFFFQAEDGIRDLVRSRGLGDVYKRQAYSNPINRGKLDLAYGADLQYPVLEPLTLGVTALSLQSYIGSSYKEDNICLLYTSDAADDLLCVDLGGRRIIKKKKKERKKKKKRKKKNKKK